MKPSHPMSNPSTWQVHPIESPPDWLRQALRQHWGSSSPTSELNFGEPIDRYAAQLLWQRGIRSLEQLAGWLDPQSYQPTSPFALGADMELAVQRLRQAIQTQEKVAIWGDFDADGLTATAVLWDGLRQFFVSGEQPTIDQPDSTVSRLTYWVPNRLTESHGLSIAGIDALAEQGYRLIVTCDTGSTNVAELDYAQQRGIDCIITDHHTLPPSRPPVVAMINPRSLPPDHPLANLSGVAVAYKLIEALYETLPELPQRPLTDLLDLVAIGLIADLVELTGESRYLAQLGIVQLQKNQDPIQPPRPGLAKLLEFCRRSGDRPTDISFGLGPRINAISRIHGDAQFCVELLTSQDRDRCTQLALEAELANTRRKALQREVIQQVKAKLADRDLSTTGVIVLADSQWSVGVLGLVAGQIAQAYNRPTILLSLEEVPDPDAPALARGSARSVHQINLYDLLQQQAHLLERFGGHPLAAGLSLPVENMPLFEQAINQQVRSRYPDGIPPAPLSADLIVTVADLQQEGGRTLFQALKLLEPCGMGNPVPKLLIQNGWFTHARHRKIKDATGQKVEYIKTSFELHDDSCEPGFPGVWWGHYKDELPPDRCHVLVELDFNSYEDRNTQKHYELRLIAVQQSPLLMNAALPTVWLQDARRSDSATQEAQSSYDPSRPASPLLPIAQPPATVDQESRSTAILLRACPSSWSEFYAYCDRARTQQQPLVLAYGPPTPIPPPELWQRFVGIAKYLSRTEQSIPYEQLRQTLQLGDRSIAVGLQALKWIGFESEVDAERVRFCSNAAPIKQERDTEVAVEFYAAVQEEQFLRQYFYEVPIVLLQSIADRAAYTEVFA